MRRKLAREHARESLDPCLRCDVDRLALDREGYAKRREIDDATLAAPNERGRDLLAAIDRSEEIGLDNPLHRLGWRRDHEIHRGDSCRIDQRERTRVAANVAHRIGNRVRIRDVRLSHLVRAVTDRLASESDHPIAGFVQTVGAEVSKPSRCAGDDYGVRR